MFFPLYKLLGGKQRTRLRAYASQLQNGWGVGRKPARTPGEYAAAAQEAVDRGFDAVKFNFLTFRPDEGRYPTYEQTAYLSHQYMNTAEERISAVREVLGQNGDIILENHCYTDVQSAIQFGNMAKAHGILYYEEPTTPQPDLGTCGGITEVKKICDMSYIHEAGVQIHVCGSPLLTSASLHIECAIPNFVIHEYNVNTVMPKMLSLAKYDPQPVDGYFTVPELPGIGNEISDYAFSHSQRKTIE